MPELPEVEAARRNLERWSTGQRIDAVTGAAPDGLVGKTLTAWLRRGKQLAGRLDDGSHLRLHFGMTGRVTHNPPADRRHVRAAFTLAGGGRIAFVDTRGFGSVDLQASGSDPFAGIGPDALEIVASQSDAGPLLRTRLTGDARFGTGARLKDRALDQARVGGIGNIAIIESAFRAGLHPDIPVHCLDDAAWERLGTGLRNHLEATLADCEGADALVYVSEGGPNPFLVYGRAGAPCPRCGPTAAIVRVVRAGRPTFFCPTCQPLAQVSGRLKSTGATG